MKRHKKPKRTRATLYDVSGGFVAEGEIVDGVATFTMPGRRNDYVVASVGEPLQHAYRIVLVVT